MARKAAGERLNRYEAKLDPEWVKKALEQSKDSMVAAQTSAVERLAAIELRVKAVVNDEDIPLFSHVLYLDFARELHRLIERHHGGAGLTREARIKVYDWKERGGSEPILKRIANEAFGLTV
jgi:hypothetical protein